MKTTKKGFTLIELIVVIAIIGVLAAILVPAMMGYVKKSKIQSANSAASTMLKAANSALEELDEDGIDAGDDVYYGHNSGTTETALTFGDNNATVLEYMSYYSDDVNSSKWCVYVKKGIAVACGAKSGKYYGCSPAILTNKNYDGGTKTINGTDVAITTPDSVKDACDIGKAVYNAQHPASGTGSGTGSGETPAA